MKYEVLVLEIAIPVTEAGWSVSVQRTAPEISNHVDRGIIVQRSARQHIISIPNASDKEFILAARKETREL